jgi:hypothetical protein
MLYLLWSLNSPPLESNTKKKDIKCTRESFIDHDLYVWKSNKIMNMNLT